MVRRVTPIAACEVQPGMVLYFGGLDREVVEVRRRPYRPDDGERRIKIVFFDVAVEDGEGRTVYLVEEE